MGDAISQDIKVLKLAETKFGKLTDVEKVFLGNTSKGIPTEFVSKATISADRIFWIITNNEVRSLLTHWGIRVSQLTIEGELDLSFTTIPFPLEFYSCKFINDVNFTYSKTHRLNLTGSHIQSFKGDGMTVDGGVFLQKIEANGEVRLLGATIKGNLECDGGKFIGGNLRRREGEPSSAGPVTRAFDADNVKVSGYVFLRDGFEAKGEVNLLEAQVGASLNCNNAKFINPDGDALVAGGAQVSGGVFLRNSEFLGEVFLLGTSIGGSLECDGAKFDNPQGDALNAEAIQVSNSVFLRDMKDDVGNVSRFKANGVVSLMGATIEGALRFTNAKSDKMTLRLDSCHVTTLHDDMGSWPPQGKVSLNGFTYSRLDPNAPQDVESRKSWLLLSSKNQYSPQPYEQLAKVLRESGNDKDAKEILIAKERDRGRWAKLDNWDKLTNQLLGLFIDHGYRPLKALLWMLLIVTIGSILFRIGYPTLIVPVNPSIAQTQVFVPVIYSLDTFLPVVDFYQASAWSVVASNSLWANLLRVYFFIHIGFGWLITLIFVVGITGLIRKT